MASNHLMLCLSRKGFGETILGLRVAADMTAAGHTVSILAHESNTALLAGGLYEYLTMGAQLVPLFHFVLKELVDRLQPQSILLADYYAAVLFFVVHRLDPDLLLDLNIPLIAIDTWDVLSSPASIDVSIEDSHHRLLWRDHITHLLPVPILRPESEHGNCYNALPATPLIPGGARERLRAKFNLPACASVVLFSTALWQHPDTENHGPTERLLALTLPRLLMEYLALAGGEIHLVHVGPHAYNFPAGLNDQYHWLQPQSGPGFDTVLAGCDLCLSANVSATTITKALILGIPVLALQNSYDLTSICDLDDLPFSPSHSITLEWLRSALPLRRFSMWPLGYRDLLQPLLSNNPYASAVPCVEVLDSVGVLEAIAGLLFETSVRDARRSAQFAYLKQISNLPRAKDIIERVAAGP